MHCKVTLMLFGVMIFFTDVMYADLIGHWRLDETSGLTAFDSSSSGYHGALAGTPTWQPEEGIGGAIRFDEGLDRVILPAINVGTNFTLMAWVKPEDGAQAWARVLTSRYQDGFYLGTRNDTGTWMFIVNNNWSLSGGEAVSGQWQHIAGTFASSDGVNGTATLYVNGTAVGSATMTVPSVPDQIITIGLEADNTTDGSMLGLVDDVRLYDEALSADEIASMMLSPVIKVMQTEGSTVLSENGAIQDELLLSLWQQPSGTVVVSLEDTAVVDQIEFSVTQLTFTSEDWDIPRTISLTAVNDTVVESDPHTAQIRIEATSNDPNFNGHVEYEVQILEDDCGAWGYNPLDVNKDCVVNLMDLSIWAANWLVCSFPNETGCQRYNLESEGVILPTANLLPPIEALFDYPVRDTDITLGADDWYYLIGTTGYPTWWITNEGIRLWRSPDLVNWTLVDQPGDTDGLVWSLETDATWAQSFVGDKRAVWAPEFHYVKGNYWITYCMNYGGTGLLKSTTGLPEGPYLDVKTDGPLTSQIDASLFEDDDGKVYFVWQNGKIWEMNEQMDGFVGSSQLLQPANHTEVGFEGAFLTKINGRYTLLCAEFNSPGSYDCMIAHADNIWGPYGNRYMAVPHAGHNVLFTSREGKLFSTMFGNNTRAPIRERPAFLPVQLDDNGYIVPVIHDILAEDISSWKYTLTQPAENWNGVFYDDSDWNSGSAGFGTIETTNAVVRTQWDSEDIWCRRKFTLSQTNYSHLKLRVHYDEDAEVYINGALVATLQGYSRSYVDVPVEAAGKDILFIGNNVIAVHCQQSTGGQYIDVGLVNQP